MASVAAHHPLDALRAAGDAHELPHNECYWVLPGRLLAGPYPEIHLRALLDAGVDCFIDLTRGGESLAPYAVEAKDRARWHAVDGNTWQDLTRFRAWSRGDLYFSGRSLDNRRVVMFDERVRLTSMIRS